MLSKLTDIFATFAHMPHKKHIFGVQIYALLCRDSRHSAAHPCSRKKSNLFPYRHSFSAFYLSRQGVSLELILLESFPAKTTCICFPLSSSYPHSPIYHKVLGTS